MAELPLRALGRNPLQVTTFGLGTAPLTKPDGSESPAEAVATIQAAYEAGVRLFDTAPLYGIGASEERLGEALRAYPRSSYVLSSKVGRVLNADRSGWEFDFSRDGVMRSLEGSLKRLGVDQLDIVLVHDPDDHEREALESAFPTLLDLRAQGLVKAIGSGMNQWEMLDHFAAQVDVDVFLLAGRYTLLEQTSLGFLERCRAKGIGIFLGGVFNSGILATGPVDGASYNYRPAPPEVLAKATAISAVCDRHGVPLSVVALHFARAHPAVTALAVGAVTPAEVRANLAALGHPVPGALWDDLRHEALIDADAPTPG